MNPRFRGELTPKRQKLHRAIEQAGDQFERRGSARIAPAAVPGVENKFFLKIGAREQLMRAAAHMRLAFFDDGAIAQGGADVTGEIFRIGILQIDAVAHLGGERENGGIAHRII